MGGRPAFLLPVGEERKPIFVVAFRLLSVEAVIWGLGDTALSPRTARHSLSFRPSQNPLFFPVSDSMWRQGPNGLRGRLSPEWAGSARLASNMKDLGQLLLGG